MEGEERGKGDGREALGAPYNYQKHESQAETSYTKKI